MNLRRIIVTQGDTEPASVEQQRHLGRTAPSLYDLRNLSRSTSRKAATSGRWCTCAPLLGATGGRKPRRCSSGARAMRTIPDPRRSTAHARPLSFFMFTHFTDRDGKFS